MNVNNGRSLTRSEHRRHDRLLVTRFAMGDAYPSERDEASTLVEKCAECAELAADVKLIASSVSRVPVAPRTRDFMITAEQADKLRGGRVSRWLRSLGTPGWAMLRPVAGVALSIGLVMAVVGAGVPGMQPASQYSGDDTDRIVAPAVAATDAPQAPGVGEMSGVPTHGRGNGLEAAPETVSPMQQFDSAYAASPGPDAETQREEFRLSAPADPTRDLLVYGGLGIALLSFGLLALAAIARRYFADPLLR